MNVNKELFLQYLGQTSPEPLLLNLYKAQGIYLTDTNGKKYIDLISGISVSNLGHNHEKIISAVKNQLNKYLHLMAYGEYIQSPQVKLAARLAESLPKNLNNVFFVNSGSEANEGALKLAKKFTGRYEIIACKNAYHGSTIGALSIMGNETLRKPFLPLMPGVKFISFNNLEDLNGITKNTAAVIIEPVQAEAGVIPGNAKYIQALEKKCRETGALMIFDEIQTGFGRTGTLFAFEQYKVKPDILTIAKAFGGGMPLGAFISSKKIMGAFSDNPPLSHLTTFGGHPVSCAAAAASLKILQNSGIIREVKEKEEIFHNQLKHPAIKEIRSRGLLIALEFERPDFVKKLLQKLLMKGIICDFFLFNNKALRIAPPLIIKKKEIKEVCRLINAAIDKTN